MMASNWNVGQVVDWLDDFDINSQPLEECVRARGITGKVLLGLTDDQLVEMLPEDKKGQKALREGIELLQQLEEIDAGFKTGQRPADKFKSPINVAPEELFQVNLQVAAGRWRECMRESHQEIFRQEFAATLLLLLDDYRKGYVSGAPACVTPARRILSLVLAHPELTTSARAMRLLWRASTLWAYSYEVAAFGETDMAGDDAISVLYAAAHFDHCDVPVGEVVDESSDMDRTIWKNQVWAKYCIDTNFL